MRKVAVQHHMPRPPAAGPGAHSRCALLIFRREPTGAASAAWTAAAPPPEAGGPTVGTGWVAGPASRAPWATWARQWVPGEPRR